MAAKVMDVWAVTDFQKSLVKIQQPIPEPVGTEILVKVTHCGVCHTDLHFWDGYWNLGGGKKLYVKDRGIELPAAMGHEILGTIVKTGPAAEPQSIGARRIVYPWLGCGQCQRCYDELCLAQKSLGINTNGGFASYIIVPHPKYLVNPGELDPAFACTFGCSGITVPNALQQIMPKPPNEPVVLVGAGGLGLAAIAVLQSLGHRNIVCVDITEEKLQAARTAGASIVVNGSGGDAAKRTLGVIKKPITAVINFVNNSATAAFIPSILAKGAKWILVGMMGGLAEISLASTVFKATTTVGCLTGNLRHLLASAGH